VARPAEKTLNINLLTFGFQSADRPHGATSSVWDDMAASSDRRFGRSAAVMIFFDDSHTFSLSLRQNVGDCKSLSLSLFMH